jgi:hypothetical protein
MVEFYLFVRLPRRGRSPEFIRGEGAASGAPGKLFCSRERDTLIYV